VLRGRKSMTERPGATLPPADFGAAKRKLEEAIKREADEREVVTSGLSKAYGLPGLRIHDLRHTAVALWIAAGASPKEVAVRAGHTSTSFVLDRYGHLFPESDAALRDRLDALFVPMTEHRRNTAG